MNFSDKVTIFISCSPRKTDNNEWGLSQIKNCITTLTNGLKLKGCDIYVIFDGTIDRPNFTEKMKEDYYLKINSFKNDDEIKNDKNINVVVFDQWLHQSNSLRKVMLENTTTPLVMSIQEDCLMVNTEKIDTNLIVNLLLNDVSVEYIRFYPQNDILNFKGELYPEARPGIPHPETPLLHKCMHWSDRPHIATLEHYKNRVWANIGTNIRTVMEKQIQYRAEKTNTHWGTWIYGERKAMLHDTNSPYGSGYDLYPKGKDSIIK